MVVLAAVSAISNLLMLAGPIFMLQIYDRVLTSQSVPTLVVLTLLVCVLYGYYALLEALRSRMVTRIAAIIDARIAPILFALLVKSSSAAGMSPPYDPMRDGDTLRTFIGGSGPLTLLDLPWLPIYLAIVFLMHPSLGWLAIIGAMVIIVLAIINEFVTRKPSVQAAEASSRRQRFMDDVRINADVVQAMGMLDSLQALREKLNAKLLSPQAAAMDRGSLFSSFIKGLRFLLQSAVLALGAFLVIQGELTAGLMIAASIITARALAPVDQLVSQWRGFMSARQALGRIRAILASNGQGAGQTILPKPSQSISVQNMAAGPRGLRMPIISGINIELKAGDGVGILGATGSGKSGLAKTLVGIWPTMLGTMRVDGAALDSFASGELSRFVGFLPQGAELFDGTIAENIARFDPQAENDAILEAAHLVGAHDLIVALPDGYDTSVGEHGTRLSAGQRQRIGIARAFFGDPFLIVLDEPHAHLDAEGDVALARAIKNARARGAIVIVTVHRPSALENLDTVLVLQKGRQVSFGPKDSVLATAARSHSGTLRAVEVPGS